MDKRKDERGGREADMDSLREALARIAERWDAWSRNEDSCMSREQQMVYRECASSITKALAAPASPTGAIGELAEKFANQVCDYPNELREWREVRWEQVEKNVVRNWFKAELEAALQASADEAHKWKDTADTFMLEALTERKRFIDFEKYVEKNYLHRDNAAALQASAPASVEEPCSHIFGLGENKRCIWCDELAPTTYSAASQDDSNPNVGGRAASGVTSVDARWEAEPSYIEVRTTACHAGSDGDCDWKDCPQLKEYKTSCPLLSQPASVDARREVLLEASLVAGKSWTGWGAAKAILALAAKEPR